MILFVLVCIKAVWLFFLAGLDWDGARVLTMVPPLVATLLVCFHRTSSKICFDTAKTICIRLKGFFLMFVEELHRWSVLIFILCDFGRCWSPLGKDITVFFSTKCLILPCVSGVLIGSYDACATTQNYWWNHRQTFFHCFFWGFSAHFLYMPSETSFVLFLPFLPCLLWCFWEIRLSSNKTDLSCGTVPSPMSSDRWVVGLWWFTILSLVDHLLNVVEKLQTQSLAGHRKRFFGWDVGVGLFSIIFVLFANV